MSRMSGERTPKIKLAPYKNITYDFVTIGNYQSGIRYDTRN